MPWNDDGLVRRRREVGVGRGDHAVNAAAGRMVDERIDPVPVCVADMHDVGLTKRDGDVAIGMGRTIILQRDR